MKKILIFICIALGSCSSSVVEKLQVAICPTQDLGLTLANKNPYYDEYQLGLAFDAVSQNIHGQKIGDLLKIKIYTAFSFETPAVLELNIELKPNSCPRALSAKMTQFNTYFNETYVVYDGPITDFVLQKYIENSLLACKIQIKQEIAPNNFRITEKKLWIDLTNLRPFL